MINNNLQKINEHGCNTVRIVKAMEELLKDRHGDVTPTDICNLCKVNVDVMIRKQFKEDIENKQIQIELDCPAEPTTAEINIEQMNKVMLNLLKNSLYALLKSYRKRDFTPIINIHVEKRLNGQFFSASAITASASRTTSKPRYSNRSSPRSPLPRLRVSVLTSVVKSS